MIHLVETGKSWRVYECRDMETALQFAQKFLGHGMEKLDGSGWIIVI